MIQKSPDFHIFECTCMDFEPLIFFAQAVKNEAFTNHSRDSFLYQFLLLNKPEEAKIYLETFEIFWKNNSFLDIFWTCVG